MSRLDLASLDLLREALEHLDAGFRDLPDLGSHPPDPRMRAVLRELAERLHDNYPYFHPLYAGQMLKPPHPVARLAYALTQWINPNNHALDGGRATSALEIEAVADLARMVGWKEHLGHLTGGGTMANLEALWVATRLAPGKRVVASAQAHYTHSRIAGEVLGAPYVSCPVDEEGRMDVLALEALVAEGNVGTVVCTLGATATGAVDPLPQVLALRERFGFRVHVDAAYGGYFTLTSTLAPNARRAFNRVVDADSFVIDPHKHGLQPYGSGCVLFRDPSVGRFYRHDSPFTYFTSGNLHLGEISLECSRPGAAAAALWATHRLLPLVPGGEFAAGLEAGRAAALEFHRRLSADDRWLPFVEPELDIVVWAPAAPRASDIHAATRRVFDAAARRNLHLAVAEFPADLLRSHWPDLDWDRDTVACLRSVLMKPAHGEWLDRILGLLDEAREEAMA